MSCARTALASAHARISKEKLLTLEQQQVAEEYLARYKVVDTFLSHLHALQTSYLTLHRLFWRPLRRSAWTLQGNLKLCHMVPISLFLALSLSRALTRSFSLFLALRPSFSTTRLQVVCRCDLWKGDVRVSC
eukprot:3784133-Rhodomonas_salina.2